MALTHKSSSLTHESSWLSSGTDAGDAANAVGGEAELAVSEPQETQHLAKAELAIRLNSLEVELMSKDEAATESSERLRIRELEIAELRKESEELKMRNAELESRLSTQGPQDKDAGNPDVHVVPQMTALRLVRGF